MAIWSSKKRIFGMMKGILMILMGTALLFFPQYTLLSITRLVAVLLIVKGSLSGMFLLLSKKKQGKSTLILEAAFDLSIGFLILYNPGATISFFIIIMAIWALLGGVLLAISFNTLRHVGIASWGLFFTSIVALTFGLILIFEPLRWGMSLATIIGAFALIFGIIHLFTIALSNRY